MKILLVPINDGSPDFAQVRASLEESKVPYEIYRPGGLTGRLMEGITESTEGVTHLLLLLSLEEEYRQETAFWSGFAAGRGILDGFALYTSEKISIPDFLKSLPLLTGPGAVKDYVKKQKRVWKDRGRAGDAREKIIAEGLALSADAFYECVAAGRRDYVDLFLQAGFSVNLKNGRGVPLLCAAVRNDHSDLAELLLDLGADTNTRSEDNGNTPLMDAVIRNNEEVVRRLTEREADLDIRNKNGQTALILAVGGGFSSIADRLLRSGADPTVEDNLGMTALKYAKLFKYTNIVKEINHTLAS